MVGMSSMSIGKVGARRRRAPTEAINPCNPKDFVLKNAILSDNFSDRSAETEKKRLAKPFYSKTPRLKTDADRFCFGLNKNGLQSRFTVKRPGLKQTQIVSVSV
jgi:hypothetical protein